jgi:beta-ketoacyl-acyl-carrier-protein synthase II
MRRVVVTGLGVISAVGQTAEEFFENLVRARSGVGEITRFPTEALTVKVAAEVKAFDPSAHFTTKEMGLLDRFTQFALVAARQALADAGFSPTEAEHERFGVAIGTSFGGMTTLEAGYERLYGERNLRLHPLTIPRIMYNAAASHLSMFFSARGPILAISTACASGAQAIGWAYQQIKYGAADVMLAGGADAPITFGVMKAWEALRVLASGRGDPTRACRPFSRDREGLVVGEGAAVLLLEDYERARARGARIYAEIVGYGTSADAGHITDPSIEGPARALRAALAEAEIAPEEVDYINAHGTATKANDRIETEVIKLIFGAHARRVAISSTKAVHGHAMGAAGAIEFVAALLALRHGIIPPTAHYTEPDPECDLDYVPNCAREQPLRVVLSNSFAFGGINAVLVARRV